jgi:hypothetical protein
MASFRLVPHHPVPRYDNQIIMLASSILILFYILSGLQRRQRTPVGCTVPLTQQITGVGHFSVMH